MPRFADMGFARLADWIDGRLSEQEARTVEKQLAASSMTRADVARLLASAPLSETTKTAPRPPESRDTLVDRFEVYAEGEQRPGLLKCLVATLIFDSGLQPVLGLRALGTPESQRQFVYSAETADIAIDVRPGFHDGLVDLVGHIFPIDGTDAGAFGVQLLDGNSEVETTATDDLGEFSFKAVVPGVYEVLARSDRVEIRLTWLELRYGR